jgi:DEAD/DEAH box helicase domain-containing protein
MSRSLAVRQTDALASVQDVVQQLAARDRDGELITAVRHTPAREAQWAAMPDWVRPELAGAYRDKGVEGLYSHQARAAEIVHGGRNAVVVTPTASGKTICYNLPVLNAVLENPDTRALYLFPTKALAQDQLAELHDLGQRLESRFGVFTYDGDTPADARAAIRSQGHIVLTNPDMLHAGILPHHTRWTRLFENLQYIVLDELHTYRGVFGSHLANVLRRLHRVAKFYGASPQFIASSATIANPGELAERLTERKFECVAENGAPSGEKYFVFYNPPVVNRFLGIRRGYIGEASRIAQEFLKRDLQAIVFANSRLHTELLLTYLQQANPAPIGREQPIRGYRGGYLPGERREIERGLRAGQIRGVVSTNALELGIDVGSLDAAVLAGYPGTIASTWQRAGRAGRRSGGSCAVLVASSAPIDQFIVRHPDYFFGRSPEHAYVQPDNLEILVNHLKCAAFELPIAEDEKFGGEEIAPLCARLEEAGFLHRAAAEGESGKAHWHWTEQAYPADTVSLRAVTSDNFVIVDITGAPEVIGEVDFSSALTTVHPKAVYLHQGQQYQVDRLDFEQRRAYVKRVDLEYYTDAIRYTQVRVLETAETARLARPAGEGDAREDVAAARSHGDVLVRSQVVGFKKIKFFTNENLGSGNLELPENEMHTTAFWITLERALLDSVPFSVRERQNGMHGLLFALGSVATLLLMCDRRDLGTAIGERPPSPGLDLHWEPTPAAGKAGMEDEPEYFEPNLYIYDAYPGGIGFSEPLFRASDILLEQTRVLIAACPCECGCPSCVGPAGDLGEHGKEVALLFLQRLIGKADSSPALASKE